MSSNAGGNVRPNKSRVYVFAAHMNNTKDVERLTLHTMLAPYVKHPPL